MQIRKSPGVYLSAKEQPLLTPPGRPFNLYCVWGIGGKTNVRGCVSLCYADIDFKVNDGYGIPWPNTKTSGLTTTRLIS